MVILPTQGRGISETSVVETPTKYLEYTQTFILKYEWMFKIPNTKEKAVVRKKNGIEVSKEKEKTKTNKYMLYIYKYKHI